MKKLIMLLMLTATICIASVSTNTAYFSDASTVNNYISINYESSTFTVYIAEGDNGDYNYIVEYNGSTDMSKFIMAVISCAEVSKATTWSSDNIYIGFTGSGDLYIVSTSDARYTVNNVEARGGDWASSYINERTTITTYTPNSQERFTESNGIITDNQTNLQWRVGPDSDTSWYGANDWVNGLEDRWRMPSLNELKELYNAGIKWGNWSYFQTRGGFVWSGQTECYSSPTAWFLDFGGSGTERNCNRAASDYRRAFAVRYL